MAGEIHYLVVGTPPTRRYITARLASILRENPDSVVGKLVTVEINSPVVIEAEEAGENNENN